MKQTTLRRTILITIILLALCGIASADLNLWSGTGPFAPVAGQRAVHALAISPDGSVIYSGLNSGTVMSLTFGPRPVVASVSPATGPQAGGTVVTITGTGFTGAVAVRFGTTDATTYTVVSDTEITATAPAETPGIVDVLVTTPGGTSLATTSDIFTYTGPATHLSVTAASPQTVGAAFTFTVTALDALNHQATDYAGTVSFTGTDGAATLPSGSTLTGGTDTFTATLMTVGPQTITATDTVTGTITGTSDTITVNAGPATHFTVTAPASATAGTSFSITVTALDQYDNTATGYAGTVSFTGTDGAAALPNDATLTNGVGSFGTTLNTSGTQTITATDTVTPSITGTSGTITVGTGPAARFAVSAPAAATAGIPFSYTVTALDAGGNTDPGYAGTVHFTSSDSSAALPSDATLTAGTGTFGATLTMAGTQTITATDTVTSGITGASNTIAVNPAAATHFSVAAPGAATAGTAISVTVTALDQYGNRNTAYAGTVNFTSTDGNATLPADSPLAAGTGTFSVTMRTTGSQTITGTDTVSPSITGISGAITVTAPVVPIPGPVVIPTTPASPSDNGGSDGGFPAPAIAPSATGAGDLPLMTVTVNIGGDSKAWQAVVTGTKLSDLIVTGTVQPGSGPNMTAPPGIVYQYISLVPARYNTITKAGIHFTIPQSWLDENRIDPKSIVLYHQTANGWEALPTTVVSTKDGTVYFSAESTGFSLYAIAGTPAAATPVITTNQQVSMVVQTPAPAPAAKAAVATQTTAPPAATSKPAAPSPLLNIVLVIAAIGVLAGGGFMIRRWWIRRQNPALFREYD